MPIQTERGQPRTRDRNTVSNQHDATPSICARVSLIEEDLQQAELVDLATATNADLVLLVEKMRSATADSLRIIHELRRALDRYPDE